VFFVVASSGGPARRELSAILRAVAALIAVYESRNEIATRGSSAQPTYGPEPLFRAGSCSRGCGAARCWGRRGAVRDILRDSARPPSCHDFHEISPYVLIGNRSPSHHRFFAVPRAARAALYPLGSTVCLELPRLGINLVTAIARLIASAPAPASP